jgi:hypothetical protein
VARLLGRRAVKRSTGENCALPVNRPGVPTPIGELSY